MTAKDNKQSRWSVSHFERRMLPERFFYPGNEESRRITLIAYLTALIAVFALVFVGVLRIIQSDTVLGLVDLFFGLVMAGIIIFHRKTKRSHNYLALYIGVTAYGIYCIGLFLLGGGRATYLWAYTFPLVVFPLAGSRRGAMAMVLFLLSITFMLVLDLFLSFMTSYPEGFVFSFIPSILAVSGLSYMYERNRERNQKQLNQANAALKKSNDEREQKIQERTAELRRSESNYRLLTEKVIDLVWTADLNLNVTYISPSVNRALGFSQEEYKRLPLHEILMPDSLKKAVAMLASELEQEKIPGMNPERNVQAELELRRKDGSSVWMECVMSAVRDGEGAMVGIHGVSRDVTDRKRKEEILRRQSNKLHELSAKLAEAEETERRRISRELHDQVGQNLATLGLNMNVLQSMIPAESPGAIQKPIEDSLVLLEQTSEFIRDLMADLRPPVMDDYGLMAAIRWYGKRFSMRTGIEFTFRGDDVSPRPKPLMEITLFRILQEALTNIMKHSQAKKVEVSGQVDDNKLKLTIIDNGVGFDLNKVHEDEHYGWGLTMMAERAQSIGGSFSIESQPGHGTKIIVEAAL